MAKLQNETSRTLELFPSEVLLNSEAVKALQSYYLHSPGALSHHIEFLSPGAPSLFYLRAGFLLLGLFALIYAYSRTYQCIEARTGFKLAHVCCIVYASLSISIDVSIKNAAIAYGGHFPFNPACGVAVVEFCKLVVSAGLLAYNASESRSQGREMLAPTKQDVIWLSMPALMYAVNNLLVFQAIRSTPLSTFGVARETMLIWNVIIWTLVFQQSISATRWLAIAGIFLGCSVNQVPKMLNDQWTPGVFWSFLLAFSNAAGAVATEYAMKKRPALDINAQNCILYSLCGSFVLLGIAIFETDYVLSFSNFFTGFVPECWQVIILQVFTGLAVSRVLKYVEAVTKTIVAALRGPGVIFVGAIAFHTRLGFFEIVATLTVCVSCWIYLREGPLSEDSSQKEAPKETDPLLVKKGGETSSDTDSSTEAPSSASPGDA